jgi:hypothetical protein
MPPASGPSPQGLELDGLNVAQRLAETIRHAEQLGFEVRRIVLEDQEAGWCCLGRRKLMFLDLAATTSEQLRQIEAILAAYAEQPSASAA